MLVASFFVILSLSLSPLVSAHGLITAVQGANGVTGVGFGVDPATPRNGGLPNPFEQDTSIIRDNEISSGKAQACGRTKVGGVNDIATQLAAASTAGLPSMAADGTITMTIHQVNQDGAGPYSCDVSADGTGNDFVAATMNTNVPGFLSLSGTVAKDFQVTATAPTGTTCSGGPNGDACIVRCRNTALAGPFGGCVAVTNAGGATGNTTSAVVATPATPAPATNKASSGGILGKIFGQRDASANQEKRAIKSRIVGRSMGYWV